PSTSRNLGDLAASARNSRWPVEKLSTAVTSWPRPRRRSTRLLPMKPAAPVTTKRMDSLPWRPISNRPGECVGGMLETCPHEKTSARRPREADAQPVDGVAHVAADQPQPAVAIVAPAHADLLHLVAQPVRQVQDLHVEHVAVDLLPREQVAGRVAVEE